MAQDDRHPGSAAQSPSAINRAAICPRKAKIALMKFLPIPADSDNRTGLLVRVGGIDHAKD
jgi:hypothetical protein